MRILLVLIGLSLLLQPEPTQGSELDWLVGCWETPDGSATEVWVKEPDGSLIGFSVAIADGAVVFYEVLRMAFSRDGSLTYTAYPVGQSSATFVAKNPTHGSIVFSNPNHDYPQEISYKFDGSMLFATISASNGEDPQSFNKHPCN